MLKKLVKELGGKTLIIKPKIRATIKFAKGPAAATLRVPHFWSLKLKGFIGTGLAQPTTKGLFKITKNKGKIIVPKESICLRGFNVNRPINLAVGSPKRSAVQACIYSWMMAEKMMIKRKNILVKFLTFCYY